MGFEAFVPVIFLLQNSVIYNNGVCVCVCVCAFNVMAPFE